MKPQVQRLLQRCLSLGRGDKDSAHHRQSRFVFLSLPKLFPHVYSEYSYFFFSLPIIYFARLKPSQGFMTTPHKELYSSGWQRKSRPRSARVTNKLRHPTHRRKCTSLKSSPGLPRRDLRKRVANTSQDFSVISEHVQRTGPKRKTTLTDCMNNFWNKVRCLIDLWVITDDSCLLWLWLFSNLF